MGVTIRISRPADIEALNALLLASYSKLLSNHYDRDLLEGVLPFVTKANPVLLASDTYYIAESATGALVGCGGWSLSPPGGGEITQGEGHVRHFATHPEWLGRGIGASLLARCVRDAEPHIGRLKCLSSLNAEPFYRACGFVRMGPVDVSMGPMLKFPAILMERRLG